MTSLEEQIQAYRELVRHIAELEKRKRALNQEITQQMSGKTMSIGGYVVRRYERLSFRTSIETARELGATKTEEVLDKEMLKSLYESGQSVPGVSSYTYVQVFARKEEAAEPVTLPDPAL